MYYSKFSRSAGWGQPTEKRTFHIPIRHAGWVLVTPQSSVSGQQRPHYWSKVLFSRAGSFFMGSNCRVHRVLIQMLVLERWPCGLSCLSTGPSLELEYTESSGDKIHWRVSLARWDSCLQLGYCMSPCTHEAVLLLSHLCALTCLTP